MSGTIHGRRSSIDVFIRVRPMRVELLETRPGWDVSGTTLREKGNPDSLFTFDHIYGPSSTTQELYEQSVRDSIIANVAKGYNGTVFMYGQTGSGKTYTMFGGGSGNGIGPSNPEGLVPLAARGLFGELEREQQRNPSMKVEVFVTMIELYNEQLRDLLLLPGAVAPPLSIRENEYGVYVHNAIRQRVGSARECVQLIYAQAERRTNASTSMNERSSRSHCVICIHVEKTIYLDGDSCDESSDNEEDGTVTDGSDSILKKKIVSTLNLVDLAGSERVAKTGSTGVRMIEGGHINKSLTILTTVINRLTEGGPGAFVPYRDSRLTHLLKTAIGGNSLTAVFCCITPAVQHVDETRSTLLFAARAKSIKNNVTVNEVTDPKAKLRTMELDLRRYRRMLVAMTVQLWSRTVRVRNLEQQLNESRSKGIFNNSSNNSGNSGSSGNSGVRMASATPEPHASLVEQQRLIIAQLTQRNEALLQELSEARDWAVSSSPAGIGTGIGVGACVGLADDEEKQQLRADARDLEHMLREALDEKSAIQQSMDELDAFSRELEEENAAQAESLKSLQATCRELQTLIDAKGSDEGAARADANLLREQLAKTQAKLLEKSRGDEYLQQLTRLHIEHQEAQFAHHQLQAQHARQMDEAQARIKELDEKLEDLEDAKEELRDANKLQNSLLWRLLSVASLVTRGHAVDPDETNTTVREAQVEAAVKILTTTVLAAIDKAPSVLESSESRRQKRQQSQPQQEDSATGTGDEALRQRIQQLEQELIAKDAQRDVIIDTKLKRIQGLVMKLHTANTVLKEEMKRCFELNGNLFQFIDKHPKLASKLSGAGLVPISLKAALERVILANIPQKPYGHN